MSSNIFQPTSTTSTTSTTSSEMSTKKSIITLVVFIIIIILCVVLPIVLIKKDGFESITYPKMGDAFETGWYRTLGKECKPNLYKCKAKEQYWCSKRKDCKVPEHNLQGTLLKEPIPWFYRFV